MLVASRGGTDRSPNWLLNLREHPDVDVAVQGGAQQRMLARVATAEERARLWPIVAERVPTYAAYQRKTRREIPLVLLEPTP